MTQQELNFLIKAGEGQKTEFKKNINSDLSKELVAFANSSGGTIYIGIDDDGNVPGVIITNKLKSELESYAGACDPAVKIDVEGFNNILMVHVPEGNNKPYRCTNGFYIRSGASSVKLSTKAIIEFIKTEERIRFEELYTPEIKFPSDIDEQALKRFIKLSGISEAIGPSEILANLNVVYRESGQVWLNNAGVLFFCRNSAKYMQHAVVRCLLFKGHDKVKILDDKTFDFDILTNIDLAVAFLQRHTNLEYEIKSIRRREIPEFPEVVLREAVINAVAHRNYFERGATVMIEIFDDRIEIYNPGGLPKGFDKKKFGKQSLSRNPLIVDLLHRSGYIEKAGTGIQRMRNAMKAAGLPEPGFDFDGFFTVVLERNKIIDLPVVEEHNTSYDENSRSVNDIKNYLRILGLNERQVKAVLYVQEKGSIINSVYQAINNTTRKTALRDLTDLIARKILQNRRGTTRSASYTLKENWNNLQN